MPYHKKVCHRYEPNCDNAFTFKIQIYATLTFIFICVFSYSFFPMRFYAFCHAFFIIN